VLALLALVVSIAAADSLNPSTLAPALFFAIGPHGRRDVATFTLGVFAVSFAGGLALTFGPGQALLTRVSKPSPHTVHLIELVAGGAALPAAAVLWRVRAHVAAHLAGGKEPSGRSAWLVGAGIMAVELPTAVPYLAAIAAIVESGHGDTTQIFLVLLYNVVFVAPLVVLLAVLELTGARGAQIAASARLQLDRWAPRVAPAALGVASAVLLTLGAIGLARG
jgi:cytochrome c biogenesis protein CcdA